MSPERVKDAIAPIGLAASYAELQRLLESLVTRAQAGDPLPLRMEWTSFEEHLRRHLEVEERLILPEFGREHPAQAHAMRLEHDEIKTTLTELAITLDLHCLRASSVESFAKRIHDHALREQRLLDPWAEENVSVVEGGAAFLQLRDQILVQHEGLRGRLAQLDAEAMATIRAEPRAPCDLPGKLDVLVRALYEHMDFEERAIAADPVAKEMWGSGSAATLHQEHRRQRDELARFTREAGASDDRISLSLAIRSFVSDVLLDMTLEERRFLSEPV
jgi:iron-sulfur cluster repair protein YtfE (RIC family)